jgi:ankyrin repeat protein
MKEVISEDNEEETSLFFDHGMDVNLIFDNDPNGYSPMHYCASAGALNCLLALIGRGVGIDPPDANGKSPLVVAIENNKTAIVRSLVELGADIENRDNFKRTPLMYACKIGSKDIVEILMNYKADVKASNDVGDNCLNMA